jgi:hypothetical protein
MGFSLRTLLFFWLLVGSTPNYGVGRAKAIAHGHCAYAAWAIRANGGSPGVSGGGQRRLFPRTARPPQTRAAAGARLYLLPLDSSTPCPRLDALNQSECGKHWFSDEGFRFEVSAADLRFIKKQQSGTTNAGGVGGHVMVHRTDIAGSVGCSIMGQVNPGDDGMCRHAPNVVLIQKKVIYRNRCLFVLRRQEVQPSLHDGSSVGPSSLCRDRWPDEALTLGHCKGRDDNAVEQT